MTDVIGPADLLHTQPASQILDRGSSATHSSHAATQRANISLIDRRSRWPRRVPYPALEHCNSPTVHRGQDQLAFVDNESHINRDRKKPHGPSLPHHRAYGSRTRRFDEFNYYLAAMFGSPRLLKYRAGNASASAGVLDKRHGPCADLLVFHASRTLTPRRRSSR